MKSLSDEMRVLVWLAGTLLAADLLAAFIIWLNL